MSEIIEAIVTTHALGVGVYRVAGRLVDLNSKGGPWFRPERPVRGMYQFAPGDWHTTDKAALLAVRKMVKRETRRLARQAKALDAIDEAAKRGVLPLWRTK
jgi:hypothetical protein